MKGCTTRRDYVYTVGIRASKLSPEQAHEAWQSLARQLEQMGDKDIPKFWDLLAAIRAATIRAKRTPVPAAPACPPCPLCPLCLRGEYPHYNNTTLF